MGTVVGEKITQLIEHALITKYPLLIFSSSGGARMQEGIFSLMQMAKTSAALAQLGELELPYTLRNVGAGSPKRETLTEAGGKSVPFLIDGDVKIGESEEIVAYLFEKYGGGYVPEVQKEA